jgi:phosphonatase-like hydrolase
MKKVDLVIFDIAGTTVRDNNEVEKCFLETAIRSGLIVDRLKINSMMGWSKRLVFETLWKAQLTNATELELFYKVEQSYNLFKEILEHHYKTHDVLSTDGCLEIFSFLKEKNIKIGLTTGFYKEVTDIILKKLNWGLNRTYPVLLNSIVTSDQVIAGRPSPFMIFKTMENCIVSDVRTVIKIGDTPSDLSEGKNAGCLFSFGVTNGTHRAEELKEIENDGLFGSLYEFKNYLENILQVG